jgi:OmpA-OmpF porin, OOP family
MSMKSSALGTMVALVMAFAAPAHADPQTDPENQTGLERAKIGDPQAMVAIFFSMGSAELSPGARAVLNDAVRRLANDTAPITIGGHTDGVGESNYNQNLSDQRAQAVRSYLITHGIGAERLTAIGYGKSQPMDSNSTEEGRAHNRRVVLKAGPPPG